MVYNQISKTMPERQAEPTTYWSADSKQKLASDRINTMHSSTLLRYQHTLLWALSRFRISIIE
jgi:hypothetical protein